MCGKEETKKEDIENYIYFDYNPKITWNDAMLCIIEHMEKCGDDDKKKMEYDTAVVGAKEGSGRLGFADIKKHTSFCHLQRKVL